MGKVNILDSSGSKKKELTTSVFDSGIREDIIQKIVEIERLEEKQPYAPFLWAGMNISASGNVKHNRHVWKTDRGKGMSRFPKKRMSDKGERFVWVGAVVPGTKGGRRAHPPKVIKSEKKINKKERLFGLKSALAMIASPLWVNKKYSSLSEKNVNLKLPFVVEDNFTSMKTKDFFNSIQKVLGEEAYSIAIKEKTTRPGIGKMRGRRYKSNAGMVLVVGNNQNFKVSGIDLVKANQLKLKDIAENGARLAVFTESAIRDIESRLAGKIEEKILENKKGANKK
jgi:large subunit ribosomal protein L4e